MIWFLETQFYLAVSLNCLQLIVRDRTMPYRDTSWHSGFPRTTETHHSVPFLRTELDQATDTNSVY